MSALADLASEAGLQVQWHDADRNDHQVKEETLRRVLAALDLPAGDEAEIAQSRDKLATLRHRAALAFRTLTVGEVPDLAPVPDGPAELIMEDGARHLVDVTNGRIGPIDEPGYHRLVHAAGETMLAVAPQRCFAFERGRVWGVSAQLPSLRSEKDSFFGDFATLADTAALLARYGADVCAISPVHALFPADPTRFSPYGPSSRTFLNVLFADPRLAGSEWPPAPEPGELIDWEQAIPLRLAKLRRIFDALDPAERERLTRIPRLSAEDQQAHVLYDALDAHFRAQELYGWRAWPAEFHDPASEAARIFAEEHAEAIAFNAWLQGLAHAGLAAAQEAALRAGMACGILTDLAVGIDPGGSDAWRRPHAYLAGLSVGAPPDPLGPEGQDWGLTTFNPLTLPLDHFHAFRDTLAAAMAHAGGVRIDHILGLARIWVIPHGLPSSEGCYLTFPLDDLLAILALESHRHRAIVVGEDLGTVPEGLRGKLQARGVSGMRVLWFERDHHGTFTDPARWDEAAAAMTSTHDLSTLAGWWSGRDIEWTWAIGRKSGFASEAEEQAHRGEERERLWQRLLASGHVHGVPPPPDEPCRFVTAACRHVAASACELALIPLEDILGLTEQPNLPGTTDQHPNWRRRLPAPLQELLARSDTAARLDAVAKERPR